MKNIRNIFISIFIFASLLVLLDQSIGYVLNKRFDRIQTGRFGKINKVLQDSITDLAIFGASRASHHYVSQTISDSLGMYVYNYGNDGQGTLFNCVEILCLIDRCAPKIIIIDISHDYLSNRSGSDLSILLPFYGRDSRIKQLLNDQDCSMPLLQLSNCFRYNSTPTSIFNSLTSNHVYIGGYEPLYQTLADHQTLENFDFHNNSQNNYVSSYFENTMQECKNKNIDVILMISPLYYMVDKDMANDILAPILEICKKYDIKFCDNSQLENVYDVPQYFQDNTHLNNDGAMQYTSKVIEQIKNYYNGN